MRWRSDSPLATKLKQALLQKTEAFEDMQDKANEYKASLLEYVDASELPVKYGGTMEVDETKPMYMSLPVEQLMRKDALATVEGVTP